MKLPTGWRFFSTLLDVGKITICGEESFGTGSDHDPEKDDLWLMLFWLSTLPAERCSVANLMEHHGPPTGATTTPVRGWSRRQWQSYMGGTVGPIAPTGRPGLGR